MDKTSTIRTVAELEAELGYFTGTTKYYRLPFMQGIYLTDGIHYVAERVGAFWLFHDVAVLIRSKFRDKWFQAWYLDVHEDNTATLSMQEDTGLPMLHRQKIENTTFPVGRFEFWAVQGYVERDGDFVLMLKSEY
jgi:hypothetical protein